MAGRSLILGAAMLAARAAAHGYLDTFKVGQTDYQGFERWNPEPAGNAIGWSFTTPDEGPEKDISSPDFICRSGAQPSTNYAQTVAGADLSFLWTSADKVINPNGWAESHRGPVMTYIANCNGDCAAADMTALRWVKIAEQGLVSGQANEGGVWATDKLRENGGWNYATLPGSLAPGRYVVRNELVALHLANQHQPEFYMQCGNIEITEGGGDTLEGRGVVGSEMYRTDNPSLYGFDIYNPNAGTEYPIPGPPLYTGAPAKRVARKFRA